MVAELNLEAQCCLYWSSNELSILFWKSGKFNPAS